MVACLVTFWLASPWFWTHAKFLAPAESVEPSVAVMTMQEYDAVVSVHPRPYVLRYRQGVNELLLFGISHHTNDPANPDIERIKQLYSRFQPTVCLIEGRLGIWFSGYEGLVKQFGESGCVSWLARQDGVDTFSLELPLEDEMRGVAKLHDHDHVVLFYVLRPYFGARRSGPIDSPESFIAESLHKRTGIAGIESDISDVEDIDRIWKRDFADLPDWRTCDDRNGWPGCLQKVGASANDVRNDHWINIINERLASTSDPAPVRIFTVVGVSHAVRLQPALDSMFVADLANPVPK